MTKEYIDLERITDEEFKEAMEELVRSPGWDLFSAELFTLADSIGDVQSIKNNDDLQYRKGSLAMIGFILNYAEMLNEYEETPEVTH